MDRRRGVVAAAGRGAGRGGGALVAAAGRGGGGGDLFAAAGRGAAGGDQVADVVEDVLQPGDGGGDAHGEPRVVRERDNARDLMMPNLNHFPDPAMGVLEERKGVLLEMDEQEFMEIVLKKKYMTRNRTVNSANQELVKLYNDIRLHRIRSYWAKRKGAPKEQMVQLKICYEVKIRQAKDLKGHILELKGTPLPMPDYFGDRKKIFG